MRVSLKALTNPYVAWVFLFVLINNKVLLLNAVQAQKVSALLCTADSRHRPAESIVLIELVAVFVELDPALWTRAHVLNNNKYAVSCKLL